MLAKGNKKPSTREEFIDNIIREDKVVIVEGKKDVAKLKKLGITKIIQLSRKPLCSFAEETAYSHNSVILLMDNDKEGKKLFSKLKKEFNRLGVKVNGSYQKYFAKLRISHVEGL